MTLHCRESKPSANKVSNNNVQTILRHKYLVSSFVGVMMVERWHDFVCSPLTLALLEVELLEGIRPQTPKEDDPSNQNKHNISQPIMAVVKGFPEELRD